MCAATRMQHSRVDACDVHSPDCCSIALSFRALHVIATGLSSMKRYANAPTRLSFLLACELRTLYCAKGLSSLRQTHALAWLCPCMIACSTWEIRACCGSCYAPFNGILQVGLVIFERLQNPHFLKGYIKKCKMRIC